LLAAFELEPDDLLAPDFAADDFEPEDLFAEADFEVDLAESELFDVEDGLPLASSLLDEVDFAEFLLLFVVAIALSLKFFLQLTQEFLR
jgi:hypothetical protein